MSYQTLGMKSKKYLIAYIVVFIVSIIMTVLTLVPIFIEKLIVVFLIIAIILAIFSLIILSLIIFYFTKPKKLLEISQNSLRINYSKKIYKEIDLKLIKRVDVGLSLLTVVVPSSGFISIITNDNKKYNVFYIDDYTTIAKQITSVALINNKGNIL